MARVQTEGHLTPEWLEWSLVCMIPSLLRLLRFTKEGESVHRSALGQVIFPTFVHVYLDFVSGGHSDVGTFCLGGEGGGCLYSVQDR